MSGDLPNLAPAMNPSMYPSMLNNLPVKFFAQSLPAGLSSSDNYFLRSHGGGFALAKSKTDAPLNTIPKPAGAPSDLVMAFPAFNTCPFVS